MATKEFEEQTNKSQKVLKKTSRLKVVVRWIGRRVG
jgi:hypothetical protein